MNVFNFTGNLGRDCETRFTPNGDAVTNFSVGVTSGYGKNEATTWVNCNLWGKRGESVAPYLKKGTQVAISGELTNRQYVDKEGNEKYSLEVRVNDLTLVGGKQANSEARQPAQSQPESNLHNDFDEDESSIPF
jgi:single-strand DNA-binding protein